MLFLGCDTGRFVGCLRCEELSGFLLLSFLINRFLICKWGYWDSIFCYCSPGYGSDFTHVSLLRRLMVIEGCSVVFGM